MIKKQGSSYYLYSQDGSKKLGGPYNTRAAAEHREKQVNYFKAKAAGKANAAKAAKAKPTETIKSNATNSTVLRTLQGALAETFAFYVKAHISHWNVTGPTFSQLHSLFGEIYEDAHEAVDGLAEHIRTLDQLAPSTLEELVGASKIQTSTPVPEDAPAIVSGLLANNESVIAALNRAQPEAEAIGNIGLANFLQDRLDKHAKWGWMLQATSSRVGIKGNSNGSTQPISVNFLGVQAFSAKKPSEGFRTEKLLGSDYLVVPVTALVEGVIQGVTASTPELALASEFGKFPQGWNGRPIVMDHPEVIIDNQAFKVSANSPQILEKYQFGHLFNSKLENNALKTEAWINIKRAESLSDNTRWVLNTLRDMKAGEALEVSTGLFTGTENHQGKWNGKDYSAVWSGVVPDHLAFLPEGNLGACSVADGCGAGYQTLRANCAGDPNCNCGGPAVAPTPKPTVLNVRELNANVTDVTEESTRGSPNSKTVGRNPEPTHPTPQQVAPTGEVKPMTPTGEDNDEESSGTARKKKKGNDTTSADSDTSVRPDLTNASRALQAFESMIRSNLGAPDDMLDNDVRNILQSSIKEMYPNDFAYVIGFTNNTVVYMAWDADDGDYGTFQMSYTIQDNKNCLFGQDVTEVLLTTQITPIEEDEDNSLGGSFNAAPGTQVAGMETNMNATDARKIVAGIVSDPETLKTMSDADVLKLHAKVHNAVGTQGIAAMAKRKKKDKPDAGNLMEKDSVDVEDQADDDMTGRDLGDEDAPQANKAKPQSLDTLLTNASPELRESIEAGVKMHAQRKVELITALKATNRCDFSEAELKTFTIDRLESLVRLAQVPQDFSGLNRGGQPRVQESGRSPGFAPKPPSIINVFAKGKGKSKKNGGNQGTEGQTQGEETDDETAAA